jgi:hypothetical protein
MTQAAPRVKCQRTCKANSEKTAKTATNAPGDEAEEDEIGDQSHPRPAAG